MTDWLSVMERGLKAVRFGIFQASDNISLLLDGFCRAPDPEVYPRYEMTAPGSFVIPGSADSPQCCAPEAPEAALAKTCDCYLYEASKRCCKPSDSAASPQVAVVAPKQGSDSGPADSDIPPVARWAAPDLIAQLEERASHSASAARECLGCGKPGCEEDCFLRPEAAVPPEKWRNYLAPRDFESFDVRRTIDTAAWALHNWLIGCEPNGEAVNRIIADLRFIVGILDRQAEAEQK
jgi:hypothetical protein